jgi:uncharacterized integral membrane protein
MWLEHLSSKEETVFSIVLLVIVLLGGAFAVLVIENSSAFATVAPLSFFVWQTPPLAMGLWLVISCVFGAVVLYVVSVQAAVQERRELHRLRQRVAELERAQAQMRGPSGPLQAFPPLIVPMPGVSTGPLPPFPDNESACE